MADYETGISEASATRGICVAVLLSVLLLNEGGPALAAEPGLAAKVNGAEITRKRLQASVDAYLKQKGTNMAAIRSPQRYQRIQQQVLQLLIGQELLWQEAKRQGFVATPAEVEQTLARIRQRYGSEQAFLQELSRGDLCG